MSEYETVRAAVLAGGAETVADRKAVYTQLIDQLQFKVAETQPRFRQALAAQLRLLRAAVNDFERDMRAGSLLPPPPPVDRTPPDPSLSTVDEAAPPAHPLGRVRTIVALTLRFLRHLSRMGPAAAFWIFVEPLLQMSIIVGVYAMLGATTIVDMEPLPFVVLGIGAWIMFRITVIRTVSMPIEANLSLIPRVRMIDIILSRALAFGMIYTWALLFFLTLLFVLGRGVEVDSISGVVASWLSVLLFAVSLGLVLRGLVAYVPVLFRFTPWIVRIFFYTGGVVVVSEQLPDFLSKYMMMNPLANATQSLRSAYFTTYQSTESSLTYVYVASTLLFAVGLMIHAGRLSKPKP